MNHTTQALALAGQSTAIHSRTISLNTRSRDDGLWDVEGSLSDVRGYDYASPVGELIAAGQPIHEMSIRLTLDHSLTVSAVAVRIGHAPFDACPHASAPLQELVGVRIGSGWRQAIGERMGTVRGCTHLRDLLVQMGTAAVLAIPHHHAHQRQASRLALGDDGQAPPFLDQCLAWRREGPLVRMLLPQLTREPQPPTPPGRS